MTTTKNHIQISAKKDFLESLCSASALNAVAELIWNGLDATSDHVDVEFTSTPMGGIVEIRVRDRGVGIPHAEVQQLFGYLGASWKKQQGRVNGRALHGKSGRGRFKAFALGNHVRWRTVYKSGEGMFSYEISGRSTALDALSFTDPIPAKSSIAGTEVIIDQIENSHGALLSEEAPQELAKLFAAYLSQYPGVRIVFNGSLIDPSGLQAHKREIPLEPIRLTKGETVDATVSVIEWQVATKRAIHLCDANGVSLREIEPGLHAPGFNFTAYIKCDHFRELDKDNLLILDQVHPDVQLIVAKGKDAIRSHFRKRLAERQRRIVERWKEEQIYPFEEKTDLTPIEEAERQVFDILAVNLEAYLPKFEEAEKNSRKFTFLLLAQALRDNPESVQKIISEVLHLKQDEQDELAALLENTTLSNIISCAKTVADRLDFLVALENLIFDKETKKKLLERDQLHKILENEAWIFDEDFALSGSEERLEEVLEKHIGILGERADGGTAVVVGDGKTGRIDVMLNRVINPRSGEMDYLVVELKRPAKRIDDDVITQTKKYAMAVAGDERFHGVPARWKFIAISNELSDYAKRDSTQTGRPRGQVWASEKGEITVWVREWAEIINTARARLDFVNASLSYEANRESSKAYLLKTHAKFIPQTGDAEADDADEESDRKEDAE